MLKKIGTLVSFRGKDYQIFDADFTGEKLVLKEVCTGNVDSFYENVSFKDVKVLHENEILDFYVDKIRNMKLKINEYEGEYSELEYNKLFDFLKLICNKTKKHLRATGVSE